MTTTTQSDATLRIGANGGLFGASIDLQSLRVHFGDLNGNCLVGTLCKQPASFRSTGFAFNTSEGAIMLPACTSLVASAAFAVWVKPPACTIPETQTVYHASDHQHVALSLALWCEKGDSAAWRVRLLAGSHTTQNTDVDPSTLLQWSPTSLPSAVWSHVLLIRNGSALQFFVNGTLAVSRCSTD